MIRWTEPTGHPRRGLAARILFVLLAIAGAVATTSAAAPTAR